MAVQPQQRLMLLDDVGQGLTAGMNLRGEAHLVDDLQVLIELGTSIQRRAEWRDVDIKDAPAHVRDLRKELSEARDVLLLRILAFGVPRRRRRASAIQHLISALELAYLHFMEIEMRSLGQDLINFAEIIVARNSHKRDVSPL